MNNDNVDKLANIKENHDDEISLKEYIESKLESIRHETLLAKEAFELRLASTAHEIVVAKDNLEQRLSATKNETALAKESMAHEILISKDNLEQRLNAMKSETTLAKENMEKRLDAMNEFRRVLSDQTQRFITHEEHSIVQSMISQIQFDMKDIPIKFISKEDFKSTEKVLDNIRDENKTIESKFIPRIEHYSVHDRLAEDVRILREAKESFGQQLGSLKSETTLAKESMEKRLDTMNEFRSALSDQAQRFITREEHSIVQSMISQIQIDLKDIAIKFISKEEFKGTERELDNIRDENNTIESKFIPRIEHNSIHDRLTEDVRILREAKAHVEGKASQLSVIVFGSIATLSLLFSIIGALINYYK